MLRTVILRHDLPDGSWHFDWMLERHPPVSVPAIPTPSSLLAPFDDPDSRRLMTFRSAIRPDEAGSSPFEATRLPDHRLAYLVFEGPLSGDRGRVRRLCSGTYTILDATELTLDLSVRFDRASAPSRIVGRSSGSEIWIFSLHP